MPCVDYCNGHSNICINNGTEPLFSEDMDEDDIARLLKEGPRGPAQCLRCANLTTGDRCDDCITGELLQNNYYMLRKVK